MSQSIIPDNSRPLAPEITWINVPKPKFFNVFPGKNPEISIGGGIQDTDFNKGFTKGMFTKNLRRRIGGVRAPKGTVDDKKYPPHRAQKRNV